MDLCKNVMLENDVLEDLVTIAGNYLLEAEHALNCCYSLARVVAADQKMDLGSLIESVRSDIENIREIFLGDE